MKIGLYNVTTYMAPLGSAEVGGLETYVISLAGQLAARGHQVDLWSGSEEGEMGVEEVEPGCRKRLYPFLETKQVPDIGTRFQRLVQRLHFTRTTQGDFLRENYDVAWIFKPYDFLSAWWWRQKGFSGKIVASLHGKEYFPSDRWFSKSVDLFYSVQSTLSVELEKRYRKPVAVFYNTWNDTVFKPVHRPVEPVEPWVMSVGRLVPIKGFDRLIEAFARNSDGLNKARLAIIGEGPEKEKLISQTRTLGVESRVHFPGRLSPEEIRAWHLRARLYIQPSIGDETFSLSTFEAMCSGLPVLASHRVAIAREFSLVPGVALYSAEDTAQLAEEMKRLMNTPWSILCEQQRKVRDRLERDYSLEGVMSALEQFVMSKGTRA